MADAALTLDRFRSATVERTVWACALALLVVVTRLGSIETEVSDWDESTFVLMASDVMRGHLPYVHLFDNKPPFMFLALAGAMSVFGESLLVVRLFGAFCVALTCVLAFNVAVRFTSTTAAGLGAGLLAAVSAVGFGQSTQTEQLAAALMMSALYVALRWRSSLWSAAAVGVLMSLATLTRSNLILVVIALGVYYALVFLRAWPGTHRFSIAAYVAAGLAPPLILIAVYALAGQLDILIMALVEVPAAYATQQASLLDTLRLHFWIWRQFTFAWAPFVFVPLTILSAWGAFIFAKRLSRERSKNSSEADELSVVALMFVSAAGSLVIGGVAYAHYWTQVLPFAAIASAVALGDRPLRSLSSSIKFALCAVAIGFIALKDIPAAVRVALDWRAVEASHEVRQAAALIDADRAPADTVWALQHHLVLWYLDLPPVSPAATHPDNIVRAPIIRALTRAGYVQEGEFERVLASLPRYVVTGPEPTPDYLEGERAGQFESWLAAHYERWREVPPVLIYRRRLPADVSIRGLSEVEWSHARAPSQAPDPATP